jgi:hypothetical protein
MINIEKQSSCFKGSGGAKSSGRKGPNQSTEIMAPAMPNNPSEADVSRVFLKFYDGLFAAKESSGEPFFRKLSKYFTSL